MQQDITSAGRSQTVHNMVSRVLRPFLTSSSSTTSSLIGMEDVTRSRKGVEESLQPSEEEVRLWARSFDKLMRNLRRTARVPRGLRTEYSAGEHDVWLACEDLKRRAIGAWWRRRPLHLRRHTSPPLSKEVSLDSRVREVINKKMQEPTALTFDDAQLQIYTLMHRDSYPRFLSSSIYSALIHGGSRSSSEC
ncbi:unnamed protein product [Boreogadus saida]